MDDVLPKRQLWHSQSTHVSCHQVALAAQTASDRLVEDGRHRRRRMCRYWHHTRTGPQSNPAASRRPTPGVRVRARPSLHFRSRWFGRSCSDAQWDVSRACCPPRCSGRLGTATGSRHSCASREACARPLCSAGRTVQCGFGRISERLTELGCNRRDVHPVAPYSCTVRANMLTPRRNAHGRLR